MPRKQSTPAPAAAPAAPWLMAVQLSCDLPKGWPTMVTAMPPASTEVQPEGTVSLWVCLPTVARAAAPPARCPPQPCWAAGFPHCICDPARTDCARERVLGKLDKARGRGRHVWHRRRCCRRRHYLWHCRHPHFFHSTAGLPLESVRSSGAGERGS